MKPLIVVLLLFTSVNVGAQGRFVQVAYTGYFASGSCWTMSYSDYDYRLFILNDTSIKIDLVIHNRIFMHEQSSISTFYGKGTFRNDTLSIVYTAIPSIQTINKQLPRRKKYIPAPNERIFYPPTVFVISRESVRDLNSDFPVLNKVSPAVAMNMPQPK